MTDETPSPGLELLLRVQEQDTAIDQLRHRRSHLPELEALAELRRRRDDLVARRSELVEARDGIASGQAAREQELDATEVRIAELDERLSTGTGYRDLERMSEEQSHLKQRRSTLEDEILEVLEQLEPAEAAIAEVDGELTAMAAEESRLESAVAAAQSEIDTEIAAVAAARAADAAGLAPELAADYERLRERLGGIGAARLVNGSCAGCHLSLPATELDRIRRQPPGTVTHCDQCGRILVV